MSDVKNGLSRSELLKIDVSGPLAPAFEILNSLDHPVVLDVGAGPCRDIVNIHNTLNARGAFIAVDYDLQRAFDAVEANPDLIDVCYHNDQIKHITDGLKIAYIVNDVMKLDLPEETRADFILSLALAMFIAKEDLENYAKTLVSNARSGAHIFHLHSIDRPAPKNPDRPQYPEGYHHHSINDLRTVFETQGCRVEELPAIEDKAGRGFDWYRLDIIVP